MRLTSEEKNAVATFVHEWTPNPTVAEMLRCSIGRIAVKRLRELQARSAGVAVTLSGALPDHDDIQHIVDWLTADFIDGADWIERIDAHRRPLKLMKCGSIEQLLHEAVKAMRKRFQGTGAALREGDESLAAELSEGYTVVRLHTPRALDHESSRLQHCVGHGSYDEEVVHGTVEIYSLRDRNGDPCATVQADVDLIERKDLAHGGVRTKTKIPYTRSVAQIKGFRNSQPSMLTMQVLKDFLCEFSDWRFWYPIVTDVHGQEHDAAWIPEGTEFQRLNFKEINALPEEPIILPDNLVVQGNLDLAEARIEWLPQRLKVGGNLDIADNIINRWPDNMEIGGCILGGENSARQLMPEYVVSKMEAGEAWKKAESIRIQGIWTKWIESDAGAYNDTEGSGGLGLGMFPVEALGVLTPSRR